MIIIIKNDDSSDNNNNNNNNDNNKCNFDLLPHFLPRHLHFLFFH